MVKNPYESPALQVPGGRTLLDKVRTLRSIVAALCGAIVFQWFCHLATALAMVSWMEKVEGAPTSKTLDSLFSGFLCVGTTALLALGPAFFAWRYIRSGQTNGTTE